MALCLVALPAAAKNNFTLLRDGAHWLTPEAAAEVAQLQFEILKLHQRAVLVESVASLPGNERERVKAVKARFDRMAPNAIYILASRQPPEVFVGLGADLKKDFVDLSALRNRLVEVVAESLGENRFDRGIRQALLTVRRAYEPAEAEEPKIVALWDRDVDLKQLFAFLIPGLALFFGARFWLGRRSSEVST